jgi:predicted DNA binding CopG/RHH family protein
MTNLSNEEQDLLDSIEQGEWHSKGNLQSRKEELKKYVQQQTLANQHHFQCVLSERDFVALKSLAAKKKMNYQLLAKNVLHQFINHELDVSGL